MAQINKGSAVNVEVTFFRKPPFATPSLFDPQSPTISVIAPDGTKIVDTQPLTKSSTGKYFYTLQTQETDQEGNYKVEVKGGDGTYTDVKIDPLAFQLV